MEILCQRVTAFTVKNCNGKIPDQIDFEKDDLAILDKFKSNLDLIRKKIDNQDVNFYIEFIINSLFETNKYFNDQEPWKKKDNITRLNTIVYTSLEIIRKISFMLISYYPKFKFKCFKNF